MKPHITLFDAFFDIEQNPIVGMGPLMLTEKEGTGQLYCDVFFKHYAHRLRINIGMGVYVDAPVSERFHYLDTQLDYEIVSRGVKERFTITQLEFIHNLQDLKQTILDNPTKPFELWQFIPPGRDPKKELQELFDLYAGISQRLKPKS